MFLFLVNDIVEYIYVFFFCRIYEPKHGAATLAAVNCHARGPGYVCFVTNDFATEHRCVLLLKLFSAGTVFFLVKNSFDFAEQKLLLPIFVCQNGVTDFSNYL